MPPPTHTRRDFFRAISGRARAILLLGIFSTFCGLGGILVFTGYVPIRPVWICAVMILHSGVASALWALGFMWRRWLIGVALAFSAVVPSVFMVWAYRSGLVEARIDSGGAGLVLAIATAACIIGGYVCFVVFVQNEVTHKIRMQAELGLAQKIHESLVPPIDISMPGALVHARSLASSEMGGDLIDAIRSGDRLDLILADVSGHGVRAGVVMGMLKAALRTELSRSRAHCPPGLGETLCAVNSVLSDVVAPGMFATLAAVRIDAAEPRALRTVSCSLAGHLPILHISAAGHLREWPNDHLPLALHADEPYASFDIECEAGDLLVLYTDGLTEAADGGAKQFGHGRLGAVACAHRSEPLPDIADAMLQAVRTFADEQVDDQTLLLIRVL